jgi:hypothetical protein
MAKTNGSYARQVAFTASVTPNDTVDLSQGATRALLVGEDGDVAIVYANGSEDTIFLIAGVFHPVSVARVKSTGTTATGIKAAY